MLGSVPVDLENLIVGNTTETFHQLQNASTELSLGCEIHVVK